MTKPKKDLTGMKFAHLLVIRQADDYINPSGKRRTQWLCQCDCGKNIIAEGTNIVRGNTESCGCIRSICHTKHGDRHTRLYRNWCNIKTRCFNKNNKTYQRYGARGIMMYDEWANNYEAFRDWAENNGYADNLSIDRIDNNGDYCPENCRWTNMKEQANNRRSSRYVSVDGICKSLATWADDLGYSRSIFHARAKLYHTTIEEQVEYLYRQFLSISV